MKDVARGARLHRAIREGVLSLLDALIGFAILESQDDSCLRCRGKFEFIVTKGREIQRGVQNLLDMLSGEDVGREYDEDRTFSLHELLDDLSGEFHSALRDRNLEFVIYVEEEVHGLYSGSLELIRRALSCLLDNSIKFTPPGGGLVLAVQRVVSENNKNVELTFTLCDSGAGIPEEVSERVMKPFRRADETLTGRRGMGLGLSVAAELIGRIGGSMELTTKVGRGTQVRFRMNCIQYNESEREEVSMKRALVVDDVAVNRQVLYRMLQKNGWSVDQACDGHEAVEAVKKTIYDVIFMDINMPVMNGIQAREVIVQLESDLGRDPGSTIIAHTTSVEPGAREKYVHLGFRDLLPKPFSKGLLFSLLRDIA